HSIDPFKQDLEKEVKKIKYCGADVVFECSGNSKVAESALHLVRRGGYVIWFGVSPKGETIPITPFDINENEITIRGSFNNPFTQLKAIELLSSNKIKTKKLVNPRIQIEEFNKVWEIFGSDDTMRIMITIK
ncbi:MAG: zinc-binding dehydrogenase, partial [Candidatus Humimicrobiaceae bacterium]